MNSINDTHMSSLSSAAADIPSSAAELPKPVSSDTISQSQSQSSSLVLCHRPAPPAFSDEDGDATGSIKSELSSIASDSPGPKAPSSSSSSRSASPSRMPNSGRPHIAALGETSAQGSMRSGSVSSVSRSPSYTSRPEPRKPAQRLNEAAANPELYGLRRSGRATKQSYIDSSSGEDDDSGDALPGRASRNVKSAKRAAALKSKARETFRSAARDDGSESSDDYAQRTHRKAGAPKAGTRRTVGRHRNQRPSPNEDEDSADIARIPSRGNRKPNYNEDQLGLSFESDDDPFEDRATEANAAYMQALPDGELEAIEGVFGHTRAQDFLDDKEDLPTKNMVYTIKWQGYSHLHDTEETYDFLIKSGYGGLKRLENYIRQIVRPEIELLKNPETSREDVELLHIDKERQKDAVEGFKVVERILDQRQNEPSKDHPYSHLAYFCKWKGLSYADCTWEANEDIKDEASRPIQAYLKRVACKTKPEHSQAYHRGRPVYTRMTEQPTYISPGGELKPFQMRGLNWLAYLWSNNQNGILADEMGLGKTVQTVAFLSYLFHSQHQYGPFLVVVPLSTLPAWMQQFEVWAPDMNVVSYIGSAKSREIIRGYEFGSQKRLKINVLVTTYEFVLKDRADLSSIKWQFLAVDEAHRLKNSSAQLYECLMSFHTANKLLITGTPLQNNIKELIALMHFLRPDEFPLEVDFDTENVDPASVRALHEKLDNVMIRRLKKDVVKELPTKSEKILRVEMSSMQQRMYKAILTRNFSLLSQSSSAQFSLLNIAIELKKASNHPYLFEGAEVPSEKREETLKNMVMHSGKMVLVDKLLTRLKQDGHRVLIFSQMVRMLDILSDYMSLRGYIFQRLDGTISSELRRKSIEHFNAPDSPDFAFLLSTRAGGLGINLETADTVIIFDSDWNPQNDLQAMARAHRLTSKHHVSVFRLVTADTIEESVLEKARQKMLLEHAVIANLDTSGTDYEAGKIAKASKSANNPSRDELAQILKLGAQTLFQRGEDDQNTKLSRLDLDQLLESAVDLETAGDTHTSTGGEAFAKLFNVSDIKVGDTDWDDIVPLEERQKAEEEERQRAVHEAAAASSSRRRTAADDGIAKTAKAKATGSDEDVEDEDDDEDEEDDDDEKAGGKRARKSGGAGGAARLAKQRKSAAERSMDLSDRDLRVLIRGIQRWGDIRWRYDTIAGEGRLHSKNRAVLESFSDDLIAESEKAAAAHEEEKQAAAATSPEAAAALRQKAVMVTVRGISTNGETTLLRHHGLRLLFQKLHKLSEDKRMKWSVPVEHLKGTANWANGWGDELDARLLVGIFKHGFGCWEQIEGDDSLGLKNYFFLEEGKKIIEPKSAAGAEGTHADDATQANATQAVESKPKRKLPTMAARPIPNAIHLVRRGDYLLREMLDADEHQRQLRDTKQKNGKDVKEAKSAAFAAEKQTVSAPHNKKARKTSEARSGHDSPVPAPAPGKAKGIKLSRPKKRSPAATVKPEDTHTEEEDKSSYSSMDEEDCKELMRPCRKELKRLKETETMSREDKVVVLKESLSAIGGCIQNIATRFKDQPASAAARQRRHLWAWAAFFWPRPVKAAQLRGIYRKMTGASDVAASPIPAPAVIPAVKKRQRPSEDHAAHVPSPLAIKSDASAKKPRISPVNGAPKSDHKAPEQSQAAAASPTRGEDPKATTVAATNSVTVEDRSRAGSVRTLENSAHGSPYNKPGALPRANDSPRPAARASPPERQHNGSSSSHPNDRDAHRRPPSADPHAHPHEVGHPYPHPRHRDELMREHSRDSYGQEREHDIDRTRSREHGWERGRDRERDREHDRDAWYGSRERARDWRDERDRAWHHEHDRERARDWDREREMYERDRYYEARDREWQHQSGYARGYSGASGGYAEYPDYYDRR
ncbi:hypothetical protein IE81DRAFT_335895 [Ceraceosorus guamensis]|uniref:Uncharacterized protein n=1 Tax=Ceraceosorus guamensis TaxID=1522189 RepID=A0A316W8X8_9BASI|nr:hypothetical protein IE81DRAFT_335895 [Ceraceosorus guamensis]PWN46282.1 hypothetical protein IE81DRAFT_335895 [Ceraceosorus guamensis]